MDNSSNIDRFKEFVRHNSFLISYVRKGEKTWQDMYELYNLYGEDEDAWAKFLESDEENSEQHSKNSNYFDEFVRMAKNIDVNKVQEGITSLQKTLGLFGELFTSKGNNQNTSEYNPRPLYRRFDD